ncbi:MAG TPA: hypothetical protein VGA56_10055 [Opitutaceae bacterium]
MEARITILFLITARLLHAEDQPSMIDMHIHSYGAKAAYGFKDYYGNAGPETQEKDFEETYERFRKYNIVKAVVSGSLKSMETWKDWDKDNRIIRGFWMQYSHDDGMNAERFERLLQQGKIEVFGEIGAYY